MIVSRTVVELLTTGLPLSGEHTGIAQLPRAEFLMLRSMQSAVRQLRHRLMYEPLSLR
jgi:hypothetical protein